MLHDTYNRIHDYLRISLTDNCNFRCTYCMPDESISLIPQKKLMQADEIFSIAEIFTTLGVKKIRLTGGEPLVRKDFAAIIQRLSTLPVQLTITTNGVLLDRYKEVLQKAGIHSVNISLDTLDPVKFLQITQRDQFQKVWDNILMCMDHGIYVKLNIVLIKGFNDDEVFDFIKLTKSLPVHLRFIEFMPFDKNEWNKDKVVHNQLVLESVAQQYELFKLRDDKNDTAKKFGIFGHAGTVSFISTLSDSFCGTCNRMRITADGKMKNCLFGAEEFDLLGAFRKGENIIPIIERCLLKKHKMLGGQFDDYTHVDPDKLQNRSMIKIGG
ncbi:GTP 3',8-cyclase MoaA [Flavobacterium sp.]|uniref:GTP 3',8-cyclase MoaA n=1 Tax=Flavobacterium sp. TaxID=239 RepID=UPI00261A2162|nr:GTP 3',8-cyclase MoaA [Flavobacterium sp.]